MQNALRRHPENKFSMRGINKSQKMYICITDCYMLPKYYLKLYSAHKNMKAKNWNLLKDILILRPATFFYKQVGIHISYKIILKTQETGVFVTWAPYTQKSRCQVLNKIARHSFVTSWNISYKFWKTYLLQTNSQ